MTDNTYHTPPDIDWSDLPPQPPPIDAREHHAALLALWRDTRDVRYAFALGMMPTAERDAKLTVDNDPKGS